MNYSAVFRYFRRLASGDSESWKYLPYQLRMFCRGIDLRGLGSEEISSSEEWSYRDSGGPDLDKLLQTLPISRSDTVLDLGCGKGGAMLNMAKYPFSRVDGVEISPNLARIARQNLQRFRISNATIYCCDAADFGDLDKYNYFYMYQPFPEQVMRSVMDNTISSLRRRSRKVTLIYKNPLFHNLIIGAGFQKVAEVGRTHLHHPFNIYVLASVAETTLEGCLVCG